MNRYDTAAILPPVAACLAAHFQRPVKPKPRGKSPAAESLQMNPGFE